MNPKGKGETLKGEAVTRKVTICFQCRPGRKNPIGKKQTHTTGYIKYIKRNKKSILLTSNNCLAQISQPDINYEETQI